MTEDAPFDRAAAGREAIERRWAPYREARLAAGLPPTKRPNAAGVRANKIKRIEARLAKARKTVAELEDELAATLNERIAS